MSDPRLECPRCHGTVWHMCEPPSYWKDRRPKRTRQLPTLRPIDERIETERTEWTRRLFTDFDSALGADSVLQQLDQDERP